MRGFERTSMRRIIGTVSLSTFALIFSGCCGNAPCSNTGSIGPSSGEIIAATIGVVAVIGGGTAVIIEVEHTHHNIKGCILNSPDGLEIEDAGTHKRWALTGTTSGLKEGTLVRIHGSRAKKQKGSTTVPAFVVQNLKKTYGACPVTSPSVKSVSNP
jgi:hypothetical protein